MNAKENRPRGAAGLEWIALHYYWTEKVALPVALPTPMTVPVTVTV